MAWRKFLRRNKVDREWREEMDAHVQIATDRLVAQGMAPNEARMAALRQLGNLTAQLEEIYRMNGIAWLDSIIGDVRYALRGLRAHPGFSATAALTLALGIGANTAIFSVIESTLIRPLAYPQADQLVGIWHTAPGWTGFSGTVNCSPSMYFTYRDENRTFEQFGVWSLAGATVTGTDQPDLPRTLFVTYGVLNALGVNPLLGRWFSQADDTPGSPETAMLTYGYWRRRFGGDQAIVGRALTINGTPHTVIGVMPRNFQFQRNPELILPQRFERDKINLGEFSYNGVARLKPGVSLQQADADQDRMLSIWLRTWPAPLGFDMGIFQNARFGPRIQPLKQEVVGDIGATLGVVMGTIGVLLLIACANVANLLLVRAEGRQQEFAIRAAMGAGRGRIARGMLAESMLLGLIGGALGLGLANVGLGVLVSTGPATLPRLAEVSIDPLVLAFTLGVSVLAGALFGVIPVLKYAGPQVTSALRGVGRSFSQSRERHRTQNLLVVVQVALALVLLIGSGLMIRTFQQLRNVQPGFSQPEEILVLHSTIPESIAAQAERVMRIEKEIAERLAALPGVSSVGLADSAPMEPFAPKNPLYAEGITFETGQVPTSRRYRLVGPGFFKTLGTRLVAGRDFTWADLFDKRRVAIVSENLAREWWGDPKTALGKRIRESSIAPWREVIGVAENVYNDGAQNQAPTFAYLPALMDRYLVFDHEFVVARPMYAIRSKRAATESLLKEAEQVIWSMNGKQPVYLVATLKSLYDQSMARTSFTMVLLAIAGGMALVLGIVGIFGVIAYTVSQRSREIGIRIALGANPATLSWMFVRHGMLLASFGAGLGLVTSLGLTRVMKTLLFGVAPLDPVTFAAVPLVLLLTVAAACYLPARRASSVDPVDAIRVE